MRDTRNLFDEVTTCKPGSWMEAEAFRPTVAQQEAIDRLPVVIATDSQKPLDNDSDLADLAAQRKVECLIIWKKYRFYVNTEGYAYARYVARIK